MCLFSFLHKRGKNNGTGNEELNSIVKLYSYISIFFFRLNDDTHFLHRHVLQGHI